MRAHSASDQLPAWGAAGGTLGTCMGAVVALLILSVIYFMYKPVMSRQEKGIKLPGLFLQHSRIK